MGWFCWVNLFTIFPKRKATFHGAFLLRLSVFLFSYDPRSGSVTYELQKIRVVFMCKIFGEELGVPIPEFHKFMGFVQILYLKAILLVMRWENHQLLIHQDNHVELNCY